MLERRMVEGRASRILLLGFLVLAIAGPAVAQTDSGSSSDQESIKEEVRKLDDEMSHAILKGDADTLERIYADDISFTYATGQMFSKAQAIDDVRSGRN